MLTNDILYRYILEICNKEQQGGNLGSLEFNRLLQVCSIKLLRLKCGLPVNPDENPAKQQFEKNQANTDSLSPFKRFMGLFNTDPLFIDSNGIAITPVDYYYHSSASYKQYINKPNCEPELRQRKVEVVTDSQWDDIMSSSIRPPSEKYPIMNYQDSYIRFAPTNLKAVNYVYLKTPVPPVYDFYFSVDGEMIYLPPNTKHTLIVGEEGSQGQVAPATVTSLSVESEFQDADKLELANLILQHIGINLREGALLQYSEKILKEGV